jgi:hypothetical protein
MGNTPTIFNVTCILLLKLSIFEKWYMWFSSKNDNSEGVCQKKLRDASYLYGLKLKKSVLFFWSIIRL